jgi:hypothetical protein
LCDFAACIFERKLQVTIYNVVGVAGKDLPMIPVVLNVMGHLKFFIDGRRSNPGRKRVYRSATHLID